MTLTTFLAALRAINIDGVNMLSGVPDRLTAAELPVAFPIFPESSYTPVWADDDGMTGFVGALLLLFAKAEQGTPTEDYDKLATLMDATHAALLAARSSIGVRSVTWQLATNQNFAVGTSGDYHAIVATITAEV